MHKPVLLREIIEALQPQIGGVYIDGTVGAGGHATAILEASAPEGQLYAFDRDQDALALSAQNLTEFGDRVHLIHANFDRLAEMAHRHHIPPADGILLDLGVSSMQFDQSDRGFSFQNDAPLDMRMDQTMDQTAADLVNHLDQNELADLIYQYGEERYSRRIARAIVQTRPLWRTQELAQIILRASPSRRGRKRRRRRIHPATRTFQALRIAVNDELGALERVLPQAIELLAPQARLAVISFHSLEDRIVKHFFKREAKTSTINIITKKPITPERAEIVDNPRARSAKLRIVEKRKL